MPRVGAFDRLAEERLREAIEDGRFDDFPGKGEPLAPDELAGVPDELRASYLLLRGAGVLPAELEARKEALRLGDLIAACTDAGERRDLEQQRSAALLRYRLFIERRGNAGRVHGYEARLRRHLSR